jgi:hypothetical protein
MKDGTARTFDSIGRGSGIAGRFFYEGLHFLTDKTRKCMNNDTEMMFKHFPEPARIWIVFSIDLKGQYGQEGNPKWSQNHHRILRKACHRAASAVCLHVFRMNFHSVWMWLIDSKLVLNWYNYEAKGRFFEGLGSFGGLGAVLVAMGRWRSQKKVA